MAACGKTDAITDATIRVLFTLFSDFQPCDGLAFIVADTETLGSRPRVVSYRLLLPTRRPTPIDNVNVCDASMSLAKLIEPIGPVRP